MFGILYPEDNLRLACMASCRRACMREVCCVFQSFVTCAKILPNRTQQTALNKLDLLLSRPLSAALGRACTNTFALRIRLRFNVNRQSSATYTKMLKSTQICGNKFVVDLIFIFIFVSQCIEYFWVSSELLQSEKREAIIWTQKHAKNIRTEITITSATRHAW